MIYSFEINPEQRPNRDVSNKEKDRSYDLKMARWGLSSGYNSLHNTWLSTIWVNRMFRYDNQWIFEEDLKLFFEDNSGNARGRIKAVFNILKTAIEQYRGNAIQMDIRHELKSRDPEAEFRRQDDKNMHLFFSDIAEESHPQYQEFLRENMPIGINRQETAMLHDKLYNDGIVEGVNELAAALAEEGDFKEMNVEDSLSLVMSGLAGNFYEVHNQEMVWKTIVPERFIFDRTARKSDLSDSQYFGHYDWADLAQLQESHQDADVDWHALEEHFVTNADDGAAMSTLPVYYFVFKDWKTSTWCYVYDEENFPYLTELYDDEGNELYSEKEIVKLEDLNEKQKRVLAGKNKKKAKFASWRYIKFIPKELMRMKDPNNKGGVKQAENDIVFAHGWLDYQDTDYWRFFDSGAPFKLATWSYDQGYIDNPLTSMINPQRLVNREASRGEHRSNVSPAPMTFYDEEMVTDQNAFYAAMAQGGAVPMRTKMTGINNAVTHMKTVEDHWTHALTTMDMIKNFALGTNLGVNESLRGESLGERQLVGVTALNMQRATIMQEPFYNALRHLWKQTYQCIANVGKRIYIDNPHRLMDLIGLDRARTLLATGQSRYESFKAYVSIAMNYDQSIATTNQLIMDLFGLGMINQEDYASMFNHTTVEQLAMRLRMIASRNAAQAEIQQRNAAIKEQEMQGEAQGMMEAGQQQQLSDQVMQYADKEADRQNKKDIAALKSVK